jgi:hypothetical protein
VIAQQATGGRAVALFIPFEHVGKKVDIIVIKPWLLDHTLRWHEGRFQTIMEALSELTGMAEAALRQLRYPDADRVMGAFFQMMPDDIRAAVGRGEFPTPLAQPTPVPDDEKVARVVSEFDPANPYGNLEERSAFEPLPEASIMGDRPRMPPAPHGPEIDDEPADDSMDLDFR